MITRARKVDGGYVLDRRQDVDHQQPDRRRLRGLGQGRRGQIRGFVLKGLKGLSAPAIHGKVGLRASITGES